MPPEYDSDKQFENECTNLMRVQHHNIVRLVGYCHETRREYVEHGGKYVFASEDKRVLCFEYLQGGSLDKHVSGKIVIHLDNIMVQKEKYLFPLIYDLF